MSESPQLKVSSAPPSLQDQARNESMRFGTDMVQMIDALLEDKLAEKKVGPTLKDIWLPNQKSLKLSFLTETDAAILSLQMKEAELLLMCNKRRSQFGIKDVLAVNQLDQLFRINTKRSVGSDSENMNERKLQATSISYSTGTFKDGGRSGGIKSGIASLFGRGR